MRQAWLIPLALGVSLAGCAAPVSMTAAESVSIEHAVVDVLSRQQRAWNRGSVDEFLVGYLPTDELTFVSGAEVRSGFDETRRRYHERYATTDAMGTLTFDDLDVRVLARDAALVTGAWHLERESDEPHGRFTLLFREVDGEWLIVLDHTSSADE